MAERFAGRTGWSLTANPIARRLAALREAGVSILDLTESNPTRCGFRYPDRLIKSLADPRGLNYDPSPRGLPSARRSVADLYAAKGVSIDPDRVLLTSSTSEAYSFLFKLLCDPGDAILVPRPSYPLFDYLAGLNDVRVSPYPLRYEGRWSVDFNALSQALEEKTRAVVAVHPNNPTGSSLTHPEWIRLKEICRDRRLALISDEVFAEYRFDEARQVPPTLGGDSEMLTFALGGLSKFMGLPQMKLGWIAAAGPTEILADALNRLEVIADTYLSVSAPVQLALPGWLKEAPVIQLQIRRRILENRAFLASVLESSKGSIQLLQADGGWSAVFHVPSLQDEEGFVLDLLEREKVLAHPGYFFEFDPPGTLVVSLLPPPAIFQEGISRLLKSALKKA